MKKSNHLTQDIHEKINFRSHFANDGSRAIAPYSERCHRNVRESGHTVSKLKKCQYIAELEIKDFKKATHSIYKK